MPVPIRDILASSLWKYCGVFQLKEKRKVLAVRTAGGGYRESLAIVRHPLSKGNIDIDIGEALLCMFTLPLTGQQLEMIPRIGKTTPSSTRYQPFLPKPLGCSHLKLPFSLSLSAFPDFTCFSLLRSACFWPLELMRSPATPPFRGRPQRQARPLVRRQAQRRR